MKEGFEIQEKRIEAMIKSEFDECFQKQVRKVVEHLEAQTIEITQIKERLDKHAERLKCLEREGGNGITLF